MTCIDQLYKHPASFPCHSQHAARQLGTFLIDRLSLTAMSSPLRRATSVELDGFDVVDDRHRCALASSALDTLDSIHGDHDLRWRLLSASTTNDCVDASRIFVLVTADDGGDLVDMGVSRRGNGPGYQQRTPLTHTSRVLQVDVTLNVLLGAALVVGIWRCPGGRARRARPRFPIQRAVPVGRPVEPDGGNKRRRPSARPRCQRSPPSLPTFPGFLAVSTTCPLEAISAHMPPSAGLSGGVLNIRAGILEDVLGCYRACERKQRGSPVAVARSATAFSLICFQGPPSSMRVSERGMSEGFSPTPPADSDIGGTLRRDARDVAVASDGEHALQAARGA
ncbi:hypothetical protein BD626DRAFT_587076 [Schizophyllum amplum]|uniref:Uncharacterized protein n=1 Tax=Schizophyllum amplum TaxID=97359 RepID=A0A550BW73_9AGAR|nr:hypothetical protein BD626DRAFT_587076 [Auriculariopsis ampla]